MILGTTTLRFLGKESWRSYGVDADGGTEHSAVAQWRGMNSLMNRFKGLVLTSFSVIQRAGTAMVSGLLETSQGAPWPF